MTYEDAIQKVAKLLRLAQSNNANEAALAAARAQEIIDKYRIETAALELEANGTSTKPDEPIKNFKDDLLDAEGKQFATWRWRLFIHIAKLNGCSGYMGSKWEHKQNKWLTGISIVGRPSNVATVRYLYSWLRSEVERLAKRDCLGHGKTWANNYRLGVVDTIQERLQSARKESFARAVKQLTNPIQEQGQSTAQPLALIRVEAAIAKVEQETKEVQQWIDKNLKLGRGSSSNYAWEPTARRAGQIAGREIRMSKPKAHLE